MKIEKAIEILTNELKDNYYPDCDLRDDALKLGIQALKRLQEGRRSFIPHIVAPLPGESPEAET